MLNKKACLLVELIVEQAACFLAVQEHVSLHVCLLNVGVTHLEGWVAQVCGAGPLDLERPGTWVCNHWHVCSGMLCHLRVRRDFIRLLATLRQLQKDN